MPPTVSVASCRGAPMADRKPMRVTGTRWAAQAVCSACGTAIPAFTPFSGTATTLVTELAHHHARRCEAIALQYLDHDDDGSWCTKGSCAWQSTVPDDTDAYLAHYERSHTA